MCQILVDDQVFYDSRSEAYPLVEAVLQQEMNKAGSLTLRFYSDYPGYDLPKKLKSTIVVVRDGEVIFKGRVLNETIGFYGDKLLTCEGQLAFLNDSIVRPFDFKGTIGQYIQKLLEDHNSQVCSNNENGATRCLFISEEEVERLSGAFDVSSEGYVNTWEELQDKLIEPYGGYLLVHENESQIYYFQNESELKEYLNEKAANNTQEICLGENLLDLSQVLDGGDIATAIIPVGAKSDDGQRLTIESETEDQRDYVCDMEAVAVYGFICKVVEYDDVTDAETLKRRAEEDLVNNLYSLEVLNVSAVDLSALESEIEAFRVGAYVNVKSEKHGLNIPMLISKMQVDLLNPNGNKLTLGLTRKAYIEKQLQQNLFLEKETIKLKDPITAKTNEEVVTDSETGEEGRLLTTRRTGLWKDDEKIHLVAAVDVDNTLTAHEPDKTTEITMELKAEKMELGFASSEKGVINDDKYIRFQDGEILLGDSEGLYRLEVKKNQVELWDSGEQSAYLTPACLHVPNVEASESLTIAGKLRVSLRNNNSIDINVV